MIQSTASLNALNNNGSVLASIKQHLAFLISQDTCNPPREIQFTDRIFVELEAFFKATGFTVTMADFGDGHVAFYAVRGNPDVLFNVHLDTVPVSAGWQYDPFTLTEVGDRFYGRGVCDIKGAAACLMALAEFNNHDMAVLFTTDEEGTNNCCVQNFIEGHDLSGYEQVIVAEPTQCLAITAHRGYVSAHAVFSGQSGHSSSVNALTGNAVHQASHWLNGAISKAQQLQTADNPAGICFNLGYIKGGEKNNMIAEQCQLGFSIRVPAGASSQDAFEQLINDSSAEWNCSLMAPALPNTPDANKHSKDFCQQHGLEQGAAVDFWTEASLFCKAGIPALVLGPGNIAQAHTVDEWVTAEQLLKCHDLYLEVLS